MKFPGGSWKNLCPTPLKVYPRISWKNFPAICVYLRFFFCTFLSGLSWFPRVHVASLPKGFLGESSQPAAFSSQSAAPSWAAPPSRGVAGFTFRNEKIFSTKQKKFLKEAVKKWPKNNIFWVVFGGFASKFWPKTCRGLLPACWTPTPGPLPPHLFQPAPLFPADLWDIPLGWGGSWSWSWRGIPWWPAAFLNSQDLETKMNGWRPYRNYSVEPTLKPSIGSVFEKPFRRWRCGAQFTDILVSFAFLSLQALCCYFAIFEFFMDFCFFFVQFLHGSGWFWSPKTLNAHFPSLTQFYFCANANWEHSFAVMLSPQVDEFGWVCINFFTHLQPGFQWESCCPTSDSSIITRPPLQHCGTVPWRCGEQVCVSNELFGF